MKKVVNIILSLHILLLVVGLCYVPVPFTPAHTNIETAQALETVREVGAVRNYARINMVKNTANEIANTSLAFKENVLDKIAWAIAKQFVKQMTASIVDWINGGFQGSPAFATDLKGMLRDAASRAIGEYIANDPSLQALCSPFELDVRLALDTAYQQHVSDGESKQAECTLDSVVDNIDNFLSGAFEEGGWDGWFELTQKPGNTPDGAILAAQTEMYARIMNEQGQTLTELDWGNGFLSFKVCDGKPTGKEKAGADCAITTPGQVIADQLNDALGVPRDTLIEADEINEIITALFRQIVNRVFSGNGLLGLGSSQPGASNQYTNTETYVDEDGNIIDCEGPCESYLQALRTEQEIPDILSGELDAISNDIATLTEYRDMNQQVINKYNDAIQYLDIAKATLPEPCEQIDNFQLGGDINLVTEYNKAQAEMPGVNSTLSTLQTTYTTVRAASTAAEMETILNNYTALENPLKQYEQSSPKNMTLRDYLEGVNNQSLNNDYAVLTGKIDEAFQNCLLQADINKSIDALTEAIQEAEANNAVPQSLVTTLRSYLQILQAERDNREN